MSKIDLVNDEKHGNDIGAYFFIGHHGDWVDRRKIRAPGAQL